MTFKEFLLLSLLAQHAGEVLSRTLIAEAVWDMNFDSDTNVVDVNVRRLRSKVDDPFPQKLIHTVRAQGMSWKPTDGFAPISRLWRTLAFRLTAAYALAGLLLVLLATASLYLLTVTEMERGTGLFIADKFNVLRTLLRERPNDWEALHEEVDLETASRRYEQFYIRLLDERNRPLCEPGMEERLDLGQLTRQSRTDPGRTLRMKGRNGQIFRVATATAPVGSPPTQTDTIQIPIDVSQQENSCSATGFGSSAFCWNVRRPAAHRVSNRATRYTAGKDMAATARRISSTNLRERILPTAIH